MICVRIREISGVDIRPRELSLIHDISPASRFEYASVFSCGLRFGAPSCTIAFDTADLALPVREAKPGLVKVLDRHARDLMERLPRDATYASRVRQVIMHALSHGPPTLEVIAQALHASPRTVQRRLRDDGTSLRHIVDEVRRELATLYLSEPSLSVTEISFLLGFTDASSFRRAYRSWTGKSPKRAPRR